MSSEPPPSLPEASSVPTERVAGVAEIPRKRRILQIFSRYRQIGGEEGSVYRIGDYLQAENDLGIFLSSSDGFFEGGMETALAVAKSFRNWEVATRLNQYQKLGRYDVWLIHNVFPAMSPVVYEIAFRTRIPVIQYLHNYRMGCVNGFFLNHGRECQRCMHGNFLPALQTGCWHDSRIHSGVMGAVTSVARSTGIFKNIAHWIAISEAQKREHLLMGVPAERISVVPHFYEMRQNDAPEYPDRGDVIFVGRLSEEKGVDVLLRAWLHVQESGRRLFIVGDGPASVSLRTLASDLSLKNVIFTGFLNKEEMAGIWRGAACSVVPSIWKEPFGMVVLEAWSNARPVVAHRMGALPEIIRDGIDGLITDPSEPRSMAGAILRILNNPGKGREMGESGKARLLAEYSYERWIRSMRAILDKVSPVVP